MYKKLFSPRNYTFDVAVCCIVRDEQYLPEWVEYHTAIGVSQFYIYDNGSAIPANETLRSFIDKGLVTVISFPGTVMQVPAYEHCLQHYGALCKWMAFIDADEFIVPKTLTGNLPEFLTAYGAYGGLGVNWLIFGSNGYIKKPGGLQIENYTRRSLKSDPVNTHIKTIVQPQFVTKTLDPHHFRYKSGKFSVDENFNKFRGAFSQHSTNKIQLNHYYLRSEADFIEKKERGRADTAGAEHQRTMDDFFTTDKNANLIADESILELLLLIKQLETGNKPA
jgi:hypothetical protein